MDLTIEADELLDRRRRVSAGRVVGSAGLDSPGLYAWFVDRAGAADLTEGLGLTVRAGLIYAGQAGAGGSTATLGSRLLRNHIGGNTYGSTFRLALASILKRRLRLTPMDGRRMDPSGEPRLSAWMADHVSVAFVPVTDRGRLGLIETRVLAALDPPLNLSKVPPSPVRARLSSLRREMTRPSATVAKPPRAPQRQSKATLPRSRRLRGPTPVELAAELGANPKSVRAFLRWNFARSPEALWSRWEPLAPHVEAAVRDRFGPR